MKVYGFLEEVKIVRPLLIFESVFSNGFNKAVESLSKKYDSSFISQTRTLKNTPKKLWFFL